MVNRVPYHHGLDKQFSVDFVSPDLEDVGKRVAEYDSHKSVKVEAYELDRYVRDAIEQFGEDDVVDCIRLTLVEDYTHRMAGTSCLRER